MKPNSETRLSSRVCSPLAERIVAFGKRYEANLVLAFQIARQFRKELSIRDPFRYQLLGALARKLYFIKVVQIVDMESTESAIHQDSVERIPPGAVPEDVWRRLPQNVHDVLGINRT